MHAVASSKRFSPDWWSYLLIQCTCTPCRRNVITKGTLNLQSFGSNRISCYMQGTHFHKSSVLEYMYCDHIVLWIVHGVVNIECYRNKYNPCGIRWFLHSWSLLNGVLDINQINLYCLTQDVLESKHKLLKLKQTISKIALTRNGVAPKYQNHSLYNWTLILTKDISRILKDSHWKWGSKDSQGRQIAQGHPNGGQSPQGQFDSISV